MTRKASKYLLICYIIGSIGLVFYSYTQVDLGLTLTRAGFIQTLQRSFQHVGYFQRPISTYLYVLLILYYYFLYAATFYLLKRQRITRTEIWHIIITSVIILIFSYPAFSHDLFNYMFYAKTVLLYHKNPYTFMPLDVSGIDPWLGFLHWTHAVSPYPPLWILVTLIPYLLGFGYFLLTLYNFKILIAVFYIITLYAIEKSLELTDKKHAIEGLVFFALCPLVIIEVLVSAHNDISAIAFASTAYFVYLKKEKLLSYFMLSLSMAFKPILIFWFCLHLFQWRKGAIMMCSMLSFLVIIGYTNFLGRDIQPWYFLALFLATSLMPSYYTLRTIMIGVSVGLLLQYTPFLYLGSWDPPAPSVKNWVLIIPIVISIMFILNGRYNRKPLINHKID